MTAVRKSLVSHIPFDCRREPSMNESGRHGRRGVANEFEATSICDSAWRMARLSVVVAEVAIRFRWRTIAKSSPYNRLRRCGEECLGLKPTQQQHEAVPFFEVRSLQMRSPSSIALKMSLWSKSHRGCLQIHFRRPQLATTSNQPPNKFQCSIFSRYAQVVCCQIGLRCSSICWPSPSVTC